MTIKKEDLVKKVSDHTGYRRGLVSTILDDLIETIIKEVANGDSIIIANFGTFEPKRRAARTGRNPHTNEEIPIPARVVPNFRAGRFFKETVIKSN